MAGGGSGTQTCNQDGTAWGACRGCPSTGDAGADGAVPDTSIPDGEVLDALVPDQISPDITPPDLGLPDAFVAKYSWHAVPGPATTESLYDIWGSSASSIYVQGCGGWRRGQAAQLC